MPQTYPTDIITSVGWCRIHQGHGIDPLTLAADYARSKGWRGEPLVFTEVHLSYQPRVKWCSNYGDGCEQDGTWHAHWHGVRPNDDPETKFTIVDRAADDETSA